MTFFNHEIIIEMLLSFGFLVLLCNFIRLKMRLEELPFIKEWISQFSIPDVYVVEQILSSMRFVGFEEVEVWLQDSINNLLQEIRLKDGKAAIALFPVSKPFINPFNKDKDIKLPNDSSGRIAHSLKNIERNLPTYVELTPRLESMRQKKVKHIIFVDDFVGTGDRFIKSWRSTVPSSIKSWSSRGWCKVWFVTFAAHESGLKKILHNVRALSDSQIKVNLRVNKSFLLQHESMRAVLKKYGAALGAPNQTFGYGGLASPIIFQYGCPNNAPLIFWLCPTKKSSVNWKPLFPNRSIPKEAYSLFDPGLIKNSIVEYFWDKRRYELALNFLENIHKFDRKKCRLIILLTLLIDGYDMQKINNIMILTSKELFDLLHELYDGGAIDQQNKVTRFGYDVINRLAKTPKKSTILPKEVNFYPSSFLGFRRET